MDADRTDGEKLETSSLACFVRCECTDTARFVDRVADGQRQNDVAFESIFSAEQK